MSPAKTAPALSPGEMQLLLSRAGLVLNPGQIADLVLAWRQVAGLIATLSHERPLADDMSLTFRLPPPSPAAPAVAAPIRPRQKAKVKAKTKAKAAPKKQARTKGRVAGLAARKRPRRVR